MEKRDLKAYKNVMKPAIIDKRGMGKLYILKKLGRIFPRPAIFGEKFSRIELKYLEQLGLIEKIPNEIIRTIDRKKMGEMITFRLTPLGLRYLNEINLKNITILLLTLTLILVLIEVFK